MAQPSFEDRVLGCADRGMGSLGEGARHAIYWHMEHSYGLKHEEIARKPQEFIKSLEAMFGPGASILERLIVREIRSTFKVSEKVERFEEAVSEAEREK